MEVISENQNSLILEGLSNWMSWKFQIRVILKAQGIFGVVNGTDLNDGKDGKWPTRDAKAQSIIVTRLNNKNILQVSNCDTAQQIWEKLCSIYESKSDTSLHILQQKFFETQYIKNEEISLYIAKLEELANRINQAGGAIPESMLITKIISSLPENFRHFISAWDSVPMADRKLSELISRLMLEEQRNNDYEEKMALSIQSRNSERKCFKCQQVGHYKKDCKKNMNDYKQCKICKKFNHKEKDCWFRNKKNSYQKDYSGKSNTNAFITSAINLSCTNSLQETLWVLDSGASEHMCKNKNMFVNYTTLSEPKDVIIGDGSIIKALGQGEIHLNAYNGKQWIPTILYNVLFLPDIKVNLFSSTAAMDKGYKMRCDQKTCTFIKDNLIKAIAYRKGKMFLMNFKYESDTAMVGQSNSGLAEWHSKLGHQNIEYVKTILKQNNIEYKEGDSEICTSCLQGKQHKLPFNKSDTRGEKPGDLIHMDICGPMECESLGGAKYFLILIDDFSKYRRIYFLHNKNETAENIKNYISESRNITGHTIKVMRSDNGKEFVNKIVEKILDSKGIRHEKSIPYLQEQNGCAEREIRTIVESARSMLAESGLGKQFWAEAVNTATYILNRTGKSRIKDKTPYELWHKTSKYNITNLYSFGVDVAVHIPDQKRLKWDYKSEFGKFVGYAETSKGYRVYLPKKNDVELKREIVVIKKKYQTHNNKNKEKYVQKEDLPEEEEQEDDNINSFNEEGPIQSETEEENIECELYEIPEIEEINSPESENNNLPELEDNTKDQTQKRSRQPPKWMKDYDTNFFCLGEEPISYEDAMASPEKIKWTEAIEKEMTQLEENETWEEVKNIPKEEDVISSKWVFKIKETDGNKLYKARLVARGFEQKNCDNNTYTPVASLTTFKTMMAVAVQKRLPVLQMDVVGAFLHGEIKEKVFVKLHNDKIVKLKKSLYGLKKSPYYWNEKFNNFMLQENFIRSKNDPCLYFKKQNDKFIYLLLYVDDLIYFGNDDIALKTFKNSLCSKFNMKDLGIANTYLGISIKQDIKNFVTVINQEKYLKSLLIKYNMYKCKTVSTPLEQNFNFELLKRDKPESKEIESKCRSILGSLLYACCTRPDLSLAIGFLSRYLNCASMALYKCLKRVMRYIRGTISLSLVYKYDNNNATLQGYSDADWAGDIADRKSTSGFIYYIFNCPISWGTKKQQSVSLSSCEAEYIALCLTITEGCWLKQLLIDFGYNIDINILEDNLSVIKISSSSDSNKRLKHVDIKYHYIMEKVCNGEINVTYVNTNENVADMFTKPLGKQCFEKFRDCIVK